MFDFRKDLRDIWKRLFDHTNFLTGEINLMLTEFEIKREDKEVNELFSIIEYSTDLKETQIVRVQKLLNENLAKLNSKLEDSLILTQSIINLESKYKEKAEEELEESAKKRKVIWDQFITDITNRYSEINNSFEQKEIELQKQFEIQ